MPSCGGLLTRPICADWQSARRLPTFPTVTVTVTDGWASKQTMTVRKIAVLLLGPALLANSASAQSFDNSGNGNLFGDYFVREVMLSNVDRNTSAVGRARSVIGLITFDGE